MSRFFFLQRPKLQQTSKFNWGNIFQDFNFGIFVSSPRVCLIDVHEK